MNWRLIYVFVALAVLLPRLVEAQRVKPSSPGSEVRPNEDKAKKKRFVITAVPLIFYTPETNLGFGAGAITNFYTKGSSTNTRASYAQFFASYTLNKQITLELIPQIYFSNERYFVDAKIKFARQPYRFWGIGPNTPASAEESYGNGEFTFQVSFLRRLPPSVNFGFKGFVQHFNVYSVQDSGNLETSPIIGQDGGFVNGVGLVVNIDTRDSYIQPYKGLYYQFSSDFATRTLGSDYAFANFIWDFRHYFNINPKMAIAAQFYVNFTFGEVPFQRLAWFGGQFRGRGYFFGRFMDNIMYSTQVEYRWRFTKPFHLAVFGAVGDVASELGNLEWDRLKPSGGLGLRIKPFARNELLVRLDYGIGVEGNSGFYFGVNEAF